MAKLLIFIIVLLTLQQLSCNYSKKFKLSRGSDITFKGITFVGDKYCPEVSYDDPLALLSMEKLKDTGANWVAIVVTEYQDYVNSTDIYPIYKDFIKNDYYTYKTESLEALEVLINHAHKIGLNVMLKPHIDLSKEKKYNSVWRGDIGSRFKVQEEWDAWFGSYEKFIVKYAKLASKLNVKMYSVSCELIATSSMHIYWKTIIKSIREVYNGLLTDSANHDGEEYNKLWWDELDFIGVDAYYLPIRSGELHNIQKDFQENMTMTLQKLKYLSEKFNKPVIITEIGFCSGNCTIGERGEKVSLTDQYIQAYFYEEFYKVFAKQSYIKGFFWWAWNSDPYYGGQDDNCISPQHKQAEYVLRTYYGGDYKAMSYTPDKPAKCLCTI